MAPYLITFDLDNSNNIKKIEEIIKDNSIYFKQILKTTYICNSYSSSSYLRDSLKKVMNPKNKIIVIEVGKCWATSNLSISKQEFNAIYK